MNLYVKYHTLDVSRPAAATAKLCHSHRHPTQFSIGPCAWNNNFVEFVMKPDSSLVSILRSHTRPSFHIEIQGPRQTEIASGILWSVYYFYQCPFSLQFIPSLAFSLQFTQTNEFHPDGMIMELMTMQYSYIYVYAKEQTWTNQALHFPCRSMYQESLVHILSPSKRSNLHMLGRIIIQFSS